MPPNFVVDERLIGCRLVCDRGNKYTILAAWLEESTGGRSDPSRHYLNTLIVRDDGELFEQALPSVGWKLHMNDMSRGA